MAIIKPNEFTTPSVLGGNTMLTINQQGAWIMQKSTNNRAKGSASRARQLHSSGNTTPGEPQIPSPAFSELDQLIFNLDATYDALTNKDDWQALDDTLNEFWSLCANCEPDTGPKKLFRQVNYNLILMGKPRTSIPPAATETFGAYLVAMQYSYDASSGSEFGSFIVDNSDRDVFVTANIGQVMANPSAQLSIIDNGHAFGPDAASFAAVKAMMLAIFPGQTMPSKESDIPICLCDEAGIPGIRNVAEMVRAFTP